MVLERWHSEVYAGQLRWSKLEENYREWDFLRQSLHTRGFLVAIASESLVSVHQYQIYQVKGQAYFLIFFQSICFNEVRKSVGYSYLRTVKPQPRAKSR